MAIFGGQRKSLSVASADPFPGVVAPAELKQAAGTWLATALADEGFAWVKTGELTRKLGTRREFVAWSARKGNTAATGSSFDMFAVIFDAGLERWRRQHPERTVQATNFVENQAYEHHRLWLGPAQGRQQALAEALDWHRRIPLPWFELMRDPDWVAHESEHLTRPHNLVEWLMWMGREDLVPLLVERVWQEWRTQFGDEADVWVRLDQGVQLARDGSSPSPQLLSDGAVVLGWSLKRNGFPIPL